MYVNGSFHMISNGGGLVVGVDFANHSSDFSVATLRITVATEFLKSWKVA